VRELLVGEVLDLRLVGAHELGDVLELLALAPLAEGAEFLEDQRMPLVDGPRRRWPPVAAGGGSRFGWVEPRFYRLVRFDPRPSDPSPNPPGALPETDALRVLGARP
jgi:hypothetical protein